jgi:hypothetical protein
VRSANSGDWHEQRQILTPGDYVAAVATVFLSDTFVRGTEVRFKVIDAPACGVPPQVTDVTAPRRAASERPFRLAWKPLTGVKTYEVEEYNFHAPTVRRTLVTQPSATVSVKGRENALSFPLFRVRALDPCSGMPGPFSNWTRVEVGPITLYGAAIATNTANGLPLYIMGETDPYELSLHWELDHPDFHFTFITLFPPAALKGRRFRVDPPPSRDVLILPAEGEFTNPLVIGPVRRLP